MADTIYAMVNANPTVHALSGYNEEGHPLLACGFASRATHMAWLNPNAEGVTCEECLKLRTPDDAPKENPMTDHPLADQAEAGELTPIPGTIRRGEEARAETARLLMQATGATRPEDVIPLAMGRTPNPHWEATLAALHLNRPSEFDGIDGPTPWCNECGIAYPCPTTDTINRTLNGEWNA